MTYHRLSLEPAPLSLQSMKLWRYEQESFVSSISALSYCMTMVVINICQFRMAAQEILIPSLFDIVSHTVCFNRVIKHFLKIWKRRTSLKRPTNLLILALFIALEGSQRSLRECMKRRKILVKWQNSWYYRSRAKEQHICHPNDLVNLLVKVCISMWCRCRWCIGWIAIVLGTARTIISKEIVIIWIGTDWLRVGVGFAELVQWGLSVPCSIHRVRGEKVVSSTLYGALNTYPVHCNRHSLSFELGSEHVCERCLDW